MSQIEKIDPNFKVTALGGHDDIHFYDCLQKPFQVYGLLPPKAPGDAFLRIPADIAENVSEGVRVLNTNTSGGRVRFCTDSPYVAIRASMHALRRMSHFPLSGCFGFDFYSNEGNGEIYKGTFMPPLDISDGYESLKEIGEPGVMREITINFPPYGGVKSLQIGLKEGSSVGPGRKYINEKPVVYYGSSITQGGCCSRPGNTYQAIISRQFNLDFINLGFSGSAKGEEVMADYIAGLDMSAFVYDYDHNAPTPEHLAATHERMFRRIRERHPLLPVIMISRPKIYLTETDKQFLAVVMATYQHAVDAGDSNVYFIDGSKLMLRFGGDSGTVDINHPNDLGFMCMAVGIGEVLAKAMKI